MKKITFEKKEKNHLPIYGVGPIYVWIIICLTGAGVMLSKLNRIPVMSFQSWKVLGCILGSLLIIAGIFMWCRAVFVDRINKGIKENQLITTGIYAWVRHPIYSAVLFICSGILLIANNVHLLLLIIIYWLFLSILMQCTEEKWLKNLYGEAYDAYCKKVNRCIPWFPTNKNK